MELDQSVVEVKLTKKLLAIAMAAFTALLYLSIFNGVPSFIETFNGFGVDLGVFVKLLFSVYPIFLVLAFLSQIPCFLLIVYRKFFQKYHKLMWRVVIVNFIASITLQGLVIVILQGPVFNMSSGV